MRFSDAFLRQVRDRVSIADYAGRKLAWDKRKSRPAAGDFWACCPFHQEKSSSFHVLDQKGIYKCFGCGEKGDAFTLAMKLEGLSFPEAVAKMADMAGMALPVDAQEDRGEADRRKKLMHAVARAAKFYGDALYSSAGADARKYLEGRGFDRELCTQFGIGYAPDSWTTLIDKLKGEYEIGELIDAGLVRQVEDGKRPIDTFRNRITFEIGDPSGKPIAFGARALEKDAKAKYINSPECAVFSKGRVLYRLKQARELAAKNKANGLVVAEGYFDVIAFERAGIGAVAPMGTALTEDQLQLLWRSGGEPILCFDGDAAGKRAADRALDLALPHLGPGRTVKIALLPPGEDPDDVFNRSGPDALKALLEQALPASDALYQRERDRRPLDTPEAKAAFKVALREAAGKIADADTKRGYLSDLLRRADDAARPAWTPRAPQAGGAPQGSRGSYKNGRFQPAPLGATQELTAKVASGIRVKDPERYLQAVVDYGLAAKVGDWLDRLALPDSELEAIRSAILALSHAEADNHAIDRETLALHLQRSGETRALARLSHWPKPRLEGTDGADLETEWLALVTREVVLPALREELAELRKAAAEGDEIAFARFQALNREAIAIEARALEAKLEETNSGAADDDLAAAMH
ncbi:MAG: DNA primase [Hyphomonadaceae bacterium]|nr:DNA primase [Hyphomonadaceae bacterium]